MKMKKVKLNLAGRSVKFRGTMNTVRGQGTLHDEQQLQQQQLPPLNRILEVHTEEHNQRQEDQRPITGRSSIIHSSGRGLHLEDHLHELEEERKLLNTIYHLLMEHSL